MNSVNIWKQLDNLTVFYSFEDKTYYIVYDTGITSFSPTKEFQTLKEALDYYLPIATERLLTNIGYFEKTTEPSILSENINKIKNIILSDENFSKVYGKYFLARECSTLKILVGIKEIYLEDEFLNKFDLKNTDKINKRKKEIENNILNSNIVDYTPLFEDLKDVTNNNLNEDEANLQLKCGPDEYSTTRSKILNSSVYSSERFINSIYTTYKQLSSEQKNDMQKDAEQRRKEKIQLDYESKLKELTEGTTTRIALANDNINIEEQTEIITNIVIKIYDGKPNLIIYDANTNEILSQQIVDKDLNSLEDSRIILDNALYNIKVYDANNAPNENIYYQVIEIKPEYDKNDKEQFEKAKQIAKEYSINLNPASLFSSYLASNRSDLERLLYNKNDPKYQLMFGKNSTLTTKGQAILSTIDFKIIFADLLKCLGQSINQEQLLELLNKFGLLKENIEEFLKWWYTDEVCAPLLLNKVFDAMNFISIPYLPTYNPRGNAFNIVEDFVGKILTELFSLLIRNILTGLSDACTLDKLNSDPNRPAAANFSNALDDLFGSDSFDSFLDSELQTEQKNKIDDLKNQLNNFIKDCISILTDLELCNLLQGKIISQEGYEVINSLMKRKYPELIKYIDNRTKIHILFSKLDDIAKENGLDISICKDLLILNDDKINQDKPIYDIICKTKEIDDFRKDLLNNKGLTPDEIQQELDDINKTAKNNFEDFVNAMNGNLDSLNNIPFFCRDRDITTSINKEDPTKNNSVINDSLEITANTTFNKVYDAFDKEIQNWHDLYKFRQENSGNGKLVLNDSGELSFINSTEQPPEINNIINNTALVYRDYISQNSLNFDINLEHNILKSYDKFDDSNLKETFVIAKAKDFLDKSNIFKNKAFEVFGSEIGQEINELFSPNLNNIDLNVNIQNFDNRVLNDIRILINYDGFKDSFTNLTDRPGHVVTVLTNIEKVFFNNSIKTISSINYLQNEFNQMSSSWNAYKNALSEDINSFYITQKINSLYPKYNIKNNENQILIKKNDSDYMLINDDEFISYSQRIVKLKKIIGEDFILNEDIIKNTELNLFNSLKKEIYESDYLDLVNQKQEPSGSLIAEKLSELNLIVNYDPCQKRANILFLDNIKERVIDIMKNDSCFSAPPIDQNQPKNSLNDYETAMLSGIVLTYIRLNSLEFLLKSLYPFNLFNIQTIRENKLLKDFAFLYIEKEIKRFGIDFEIKFYDILKNLYDRNLLLNEKKEDFSNRQILRLFIESQIQFHLNDVNMNNFLKLYNVFLIGNQKSQIRKYSINPKNILEKEYIIYSNSTKKIKFINNKLEYYEASNLLNTKELTQEETNILFNEIFNIKKYISLLSIASVLSQTSARPQFNIFLQTKIQLRNSFEIITSGLNAKYGMEPVNLQRLNEDNFTSYILQALLRTPYNIFKAFVEASDPNINVASKIYMAGKIIDPDLPLITLPLTSLGLMWFIFPTPLTIAYDAAVSIEAAAELLLTENKKDAERTQIKNIINGKNNECIIREK